MSFYLMRKYQKWILLPVAILMAIMFGIGGLVSGLFDQSDRPDYPGKVFGENVSWEEFESARKRMYIMSPRQDLIQPAQILERIALLRECEKRNITVPVEDIREQIQKTPGFLGKDGTFDPELYKTNLDKYWRTSPAQFEKAVAEELKIRNLFEEVRSSVKVSEKEVWERYHRQNDTMTLECAIIKTKEVSLGDYQPSEEEIREYYNQQKKSGSYTTPEKRKMEYMFVPYKAYEDEITISEGTVRDYYEENKDRLYVLEEEKKTETDPADADKSEKGKNSEEAEENGDNEKAAPEKKYKPLKEVADKIRENMQKEKAREMAYQTASSLKRVVRTWPEETVDFRKVLEKEELKDKVVHGQTPFLSRVAENKVPELGDCKDMLKKAFAFNDVSPDRFSGIVTVEKGLVYFRVTDIQEGSLKPLEHVKEEIIKDLNADKQRELAEKKARELREKVAGDELKLVKETAEKEGFALEKVNQKSLETAPLSLRSIMTLAYECPVGEVTKAIRTGSGYGFAKVVSREKAPENAEENPQVEKDVAQIRERILRQKQYTQFFQWYSDLIKRADIVNMIDQDKKKRSA